MPATQGTLVFEGSDFSVDGAGTSAIGSFSLRHGAGLVEFGGRHVPAVTYQRQGYPGVKLYQALAVEHERIWVLWFYCSVNGDSLTNVWYESTDGTPPTSETVSGNCSDTGVTTSVSIEFPAIDIPSIGLIAGISITGRDITLDGSGAGSVTLGGSRQTLLVFNTVYCRDCGIPGWTELHALIWDPREERLTFGILYEIDGDATHVLLDYAITLPDLTQPIGVAFDATWR